jgi:hypothetical protein
LRSAISFVVAEVIEVKCRSLVLALTTLVFGAGLGATGGSAAPSAPAGGERGDGRLNRALYFAIGCGFSHRNTDDAILFPRQPGLSHDHTYFGNTSTDAFSTPASLRRSSTSCGLHADTAAYWVPTLLAGGQAVEPRGAVIYYVRRTFDEVRSFPAGLKIVAGDATARSAQSQRITYWTCGRGGFRASTVPACSEGRRSSLRLVVNFPNCWDGRRLDSADHKSHMAYAVEGVCPAAHPVEVPALSFVVHYPVMGGANVQLASGGQLSGHGDFVNAWNQDVLARLVDRYLNRRRD